MAIEFHRDGPWELPEGWVWARLGDVCQVNQSPSFDELPDELEIPFIPMAAVAEETGHVDLSQRRHVSQLRSGYTRFQSGDVLFAKITPCMENGKIVVLPDFASGYGAGSTEFHTLRSQAVDARYLWYWLVRKAFRDEAQGSMRGAVGQLRVPLDYLRNTQIAIPPLAEQRRIVARIDELFTEIADGETALALARADLDTWRRALLKAAVTGELTRGWREQQGSSGVSCLVQILTDRRIQTASSPSLGLSALPEGWMWATLDQLADIDSGQTPRGIEASSSNQGEIPWFKVSSMNEPGNESELQHSKWWLSKSEALRLRLKAFPKGTIVFPKLGGALLTNKRRRLGRVGGIDLNNMAVVPHPLCSEYLWLFFLGIDLAKLSDGSIVPQLRKSTVQRLVVAVPPPDEMVEIVSKAHALLALTREADVTMSENIRAAQYIRQSILKSAFNGRLVERDLREETADRFLGRLSEHLEAEISSRRMARARRNALAAE